MIDLNALFHRRPEAIVLIGAAVFGLLSCLVALRPALDLNAADAARVVAPSPADGPSPADAAPPPDAAVARGRALYLAEGCGYCHSQFLRPLYVDRPYGRPSAPADYADAAPPLLGTQRTGPDLSDVGRRQPSLMWNLLHLFNPRSMVPRSVMPGFPWYFDIVDRSSLPANPAPGSYVLVLPEPFLSAGKVALPRPAALDLVAYLQSLRQR
jgi:hypothetical protein